MNVARLRDLTPARVALGRVGDSLPTRELLDFQLAHARARDAVSARLDAEMLALQLTTPERDILIVHSAAPDRAAYLRRPDLGRCLNAESRAALQVRRGEYDVAFILADGLSALAIERHAPPLLEIVWPRLVTDGWRMSPLVIASQGRVALGDDAGYTLGANMVVVFIGERPGLSSPDSLGVYLTWRPQPGKTDAERNCISNIRAEGLSYEAAAHKLLFLMTESRRRRLSGVALKDDAPGVLSSRDATIPS